MSPPLLGVGEEEEGHSDVTLLSSSVSMESVCHNSSELKERNYMGLSDCSSVDSSKVSTVSGGSKNSLNLKATDLRLGLPGFQSPERDSELRLISTQLDEKPLFPLHPIMDGNYSSLQKTVVSGNKRGFSDAMDGFLEGKYANSEVNLLLSPRTSPNLGLKTGSGLENLATQPAKTKEVASAKMVQERPHAVNETRPNHNGSGNSTSSAPATKAQVVGWPPIRSFRRQTLATTSKNTEEVEGKSGPGALFVKVSLDGAPYLRKVDLKNYSAYQELSSALEKMFSCFTIGQYGSHGAPGREISESKLKDLLHGSEYVLTYEDKDGDWMLVGDVPWKASLTFLQPLSNLSSPTTLVSLKNPHHIPSFTSLNPSIIPKTRPFKSFTASFSLAESNSPKSLQPNLQPFLQELADSFDLPQDYFAQLPSDLRLDLNDAAFDLSNGRVIDECGQELGETLLNLSRAWEAADTSTSHALARQLPGLEESLTGNAKSAFGKRLVSAGRRFQSMGQYGQGELQKIAKVMITTGRVLSESSTSTVTDEQPKKESRMLKFGELQLELTSDKAIIGAIISVGFGILSWELAQGIQNIPESSLQYANENALMLAKSLRGALLAVCYSSAFLSALTSVGLVLLGRQLKSSKEK